MPRSENDADLREVDWRRYLCADWGIRLRSEAPAWREYDIDNPSGAVTCRSMLMKYELAMLYALARDHYTGAGAIVDAGALTGVTTNALAKGVLANSRVRRDRRIFAFDLFDHIPHQETLAHVPNRNGSLFDTFLEVNRDYLDLISVCPGDVLAHPWNSGPIEILMVDLAKSWNLNDFVIEQWFTRLLPGGYLIQQDYGSWPTYWLPITMMALKDHFEFVDYAMGGSAIFRCIKPVPRGIGRTIRGMSFSQKELALTAAVGAAPAPLRPILIAAHGALYCDHGMYDRALNLLPEISDQSASDDLATDFSGVAKGSKRELMLNAVTPHLRG